MDPENHLCEKENHLNQTSILGFHVSLLEAISPDLQLVLVAFFFGKFQAAGFRNPKPNVWRRLGG